MKIGDVVIFKDQSRMLIKGALSGGIVMHILDAFIILKREGRALTSYGIEEVRPLEAGDIPERGVEIR